MEIGESRRSFLLAPQGKLHFLLWVVREGSRWGLVTDAGRGEELASALGRYRIRVDVEIEQEQGDVWLVFGEGPGYDLSWPGQSRRLVLGTRPDLEFGSHEDVQAARVAAGEPAWAVDVDEGTIPEESGLVGVSVDFTKGCFLGQELVARIDSRGGNVPRRLRLVEAGAPMAVGAKLTVEGREVGAMSSVAGEVGLAMVKREVSAGEQVDVDGQAATIREIPAKSKG